MLNLAIQRIEQINDIESIALDLHFPDKAVYVIVGKDFNYKILSHESFSFNSKYVTMDFYSRIIETNKSVDSKKLISSNNYLTFFCKNFTKLNADIIKGYYDNFMSLDASLASGVYCKWILENIYKIADNVEKNTLVKVFFLSDIENYINEGREYFYENILSNIENVNGQILGSPPLLNLNSKKPYLRNYSRKYTVPYLVSADDAYKQKCFLDIMFSLWKKGNDILYVLEDGKMIAVNSRKELPRKNFLNGIIFVYSINSRGKLVLLENDFVPSYSYQL